MADFPRAKEAFLNRLEAILAEINNFFDTAAFPDFVESIRTRLQSLFRTAMNMSATVTLPESVFEQILQSIALLDSQTEIEDGSSTSYHCKVESTGERGRSRFVITRDQLEYLLASDFSVSRIALLLGVSPSTIRRRMAQFRISVSDTYIVVSDEQLCEEIRDVKTNHPNSGYRAVWSQLRSKGIKVPVHRVRLLCLRIDPVGVATRWMSTIERRTYRVAGPNSLWHIDGNHKLIRLESIHSNLDELFLGGALLYTAALMDLADELSSCIVQ